MSFCKQDKHILGNMKNILPQLNKKFQARVSQGWCYTTRSPIPSMWDGTGLSYSPSQRAKSGISSLMSSSPCGGGGIGR